MRLRPEYPISTPRLRLRPLGQHDTDAMLAYRGRPEVCRYVPFQPMTRAVIEDHLRTDLARTELTGEGQALTLGAELAATGELIGDVVLFFHSREHRGGELGYVFNPDAGGYGYATEACAGMLELGFEKLGLHRVIARLDARNTASAALAARLGMRPEAHLVSNELFKGEWSDEIVFAMLEHEWPNSPGHRHLDPGSSGPGR